MIREEEKRILSKKFVGIYVDKWFLNEQSVGQQYSGKVVEVWWNDDARIFLARIEYEDGDAEDVSICELERLHRNTTLTQSVPSSKPLVLRCEKTAVLGLALELSRVKVMEVCRQQEPSDSINIGFEESEKILFEVVNRKVGRNIPLASNVLSFPCLAKVVKKQVGPPPGFEKVTSTQAKLCTARYTCTVNGQKEQSQFTQLLKIGQPLGLTLVHLGTKYHNL